MNTARSAISAVPVMPGERALEEYRQVKSALRGVFDTNPSLLRYTLTWDVKLVFDYFKTRYPATEFSLKMFRLTVTILLALLGVERVQTLAALEDTKLAGDKCVFYIHHLHKPSKPGRHVALLEFNSYPLKRLFIIHNLQRYVERTRKIRQCHHGPLVLCYIKPHHATARTPSVVGSKTMVWTSRRSALILVLPPQASDLYALWRRLSPQQAPRARLLTSS